MNLFSVELKNQPGELAHLGDVCAQRGVNLQLAGVVSGERGTILFSASDEAAVRTALEGAGLEFTERSALQVKCADQAGEAAKFGRKLADAGVNIEGLLEVSICQGEVIFAIAVDKPEDARAALSDQIVGQESRLAFDVRAGGGYGRHVMDVRLCGFGSIEVEGRAYEHDIVIDRGAVRKRSKKPSKPYRDRFGHTPLSADEELPWGGPRLIIGTGAHGSLPIMPEVVAEAARRNIDLVAVPTEQACRLIAGLKRREVRAVLHITC